MNTAFVILSAWLLADLLTALVHWGEERYLDSKSSISFFRKLVEHNERHHKRPQLFTTESLWFNIKTSAYVAWPLCVLLYIQGAPMIYWLTMFFAAFANAVHRYSHLAAYQIPKLVSALQRIGLFASGAHHSGHHYNAEGLILRENTTTRFCIMTSWANPILDYLKVFVILERALALVGIKTIKMRGLKK